MVPGTWFRTLDGRVRYQGLRRVLQKRVVLGSVVTRATAARYGIQRVVPNCHSMSSLVSSLASSARVFQCDNQSVVQIIKAGASKDDTIMDLVRELFLVVATYDFRLSAAHLPGKDNLIADALARFNLQEFFRLAPAALKVPRSIPPELRARLTSNP